MSDSSYTGQRMPGTIAGRIGGQDPMLLDPMQRDRVHPIETHTAPFPRQLQTETRYYFMTRKDHHMIRPDGKKLAFHFRVHATNDTISQIYATNDIWDIRYLDQEVADGNPFLKEATEEQIDNYNMRIDPRGTIRRELQPQIEAETTRELMARLQRAGVTLTPEQQKVFSGEEAVEQQMQTAEEQQRAEDAAKVSGADTALSRLRAGITSGTGTILTNLNQSDQNAVTKNFQSGVQGTDKLTNTADSNSGTAKS